MRVSQVVLVSPALARIVTSRKGLPLVECGLVLSNRQGPDHIVCRICRKEMDHVTQNCPDRDPDAGVCSLWLEGRCKFGLNCKLKHGEAAEQPPVEEVEAPWCLLDESSQLIAACAQRCLY